MTAVVGIVECWIWSKHEDFLRGVLMMRVISVSLVQDLYIMVADALAARGVTIRGSPGTLRARHQTGFTVHFPIPDVIGNRRFNYSTRCQSTWSLDATVITKLDTFAKEFYSISSTSEMIFLQIADDTIAVMWWRFKKYTGNGVYIWAIKWEML